ncbi:hypothetical protein BN1088_1430514 [Sphingobacterium sp. PM2-P1-29]|nr:hypothetical protein BN1088_1430514 [Sphingobacterium sp. PM2-P1-29]
MNIKEYLNQYNLPYEALVKKCNIDFEKIYQQELTKNWLVPIENKLNWCNDEDKWPIEKVVAKLKSSQTFDSGDIELLSTFVSKINSIVRIGNRLNNFKQGTVLDNNESLDLVELFNQISLTKYLKEFRGTLNSNLRAFLPHLFSVIKHCQDPTKYPIYYKFWKQISKEVLLLNDDYDSICEFYTSFPLDNRTTKFGAYYGLIATKLIEDINNLDDFDRENVIKYLKDKVINLDEYKVLIDNLSNTTNLKDNKKYWLYQPGEDARLWGSYLNEGIIGLGWDDLGDLANYDSKEEIVKTLQIIYKTDSSKKNDATANWDFYKTMEVGDIIIVKKGKRKLLGYGEVVSDYYYDAERDEYTSTRDVNWIKSGEWNLDFDLVLKTLTNITQYDSEILKGQKYYEYLLSIMNDTNKLQENELVDLLKYKKQIILQGPPGTGKTREAKSISKQLISYDEFNKSDMSLIKLGEYFKTKTDKTPFIIKGISESQNYFKVKSDKATNEYTVNFKQIIDCINAKGWNDPTDNWNSHGNSSYLQVLAKAIYDRKVEKLETKYVKLLQFHPSYTYEDFVRGIVSKPNLDGDGIVYEAENKILGEFAKQALDNYLASKQKVISNTNDVSEFEAFIEYIKDEIAQSELHKYDITEAVYLFDADETRFKYKGDNWKAHFKGLNMKFSELRKIIDSGAKERQDIKKMSELEELTRQHATYFIKIVEKYYDYKEHHKHVQKKEQIVELKNYVLIVDEINRANLSSVLGELIYALEYRGESVESMYAIDGDNKLVLPPNLYIIGTMNTADRSVGHIDYAIRRRFAFVDVLPKDLSDEEGITFDKALFNQVAELFDKNLSPEFKKKEVQLGHSYFIDKSKLEEGVSMSLRLEYEIRPILLEYVKDGVLIGETIESKIENLVASI